MKNAWKRVIAFTLTLCMVLSVLPPMVFAVEGQQSETVTYDFHLDGNTNFTLPDGTTPFDGQTLANNTNADKAVDSYYAAGALNWYFFTKNSTTQSSFGVSTNATKWDGLRIYQSTAGEGYLALVIDAPGVGEYDLTLNHLTYSQGGVGKMYILPGDTASTAITTAMAAATPVITFDCSADEAVYAQAQSAGSFTFEADTQYKLVFKYSAGGTNDMLYMLSLDATPAEPAPQETTGTPVVEMLYDFQLVDNAGFTLADGTTSFNNLNPLTVESATKPEVKGVIRDYYETGALNWYGYSSAGSTAPQFGNTGTWKGLRIRNSGTAVQDTAYYAMVIRSPGAGKFDLTLNFETYKQGGAGEVYILPGVVNNAAILEAFEEEALISYNCLDAAVTGYPCGTNTASGSYTFAADTQYTVVFKSPANSAAGMLYLLSLKAVTAGQQPEETTAPEGTTAPQGTTVPEETTAPQETTVPEETTAPEETSVPEETTPAQQMDYNFQLSGNTNFTLADGSAFDGKTMTATSGAATAVKGYYNSGALNWYPFALTTRLNQVTFGDAARWDGIRADTASGATGYVALKMRAPGAATYDLALNYQLFNKGGAGEMYILPGEIATGDIAAAIAAATPVITFNCEGDNDTYGPQARATGSYTFGNEEMFTAVFNLPEGGGSNMIYLLSLVAYIQGTMPQDPNQPVNPNPPVQLDKAEYDFTQVEAIEGTGMPAGKHSAVNALYQSGEINWNYAGRSTNCAAASMGGTNPETNKYAGAWSGMRFAAKPGGSWVAYTIASPGTGEYAVQVHYQKHKVLGAVSVYLLPGNTADINEALKTATAIGTYNCYEDTTEYMDAATKMTATVDLTAGEEYILVFHVANNTEKNIYATVDGVTVALPGLLVEQDSGKDAVQLDKAEYDFTVVEAVRGTGMPTGKHNAINTLYLKGELNWNYQGRSKNNQAATYGGINPETGKNAGAWTGMRFAAKTGGGWVAYKIQSPGTGHYLVTVNYEKYSGQGNVMTYVLPGDTADIDAALQTTEPIGSYNCFQSGEGYIPGSATMDRSAQFVAGEEYILVFYIANETAKPIYGSVNGVVLQHTAEAVNNEKGALDQIIYNFNLGQTDLKYDGGSFNGRNITSAAVNKYIKGYYYEELVNWHYHGTIPTLAYTATFGNIAQGNVWDGLVIYAKDRKTKDTAQNFYIAFNIRSPGTGEYKLTVDYGVHMHGARQGSVYILPAGTTDIAAAIASGKAVGTINYDNGSIITTDPMEHGRTTFGNAISMEAGKEYILVFTSDVMGRANNRLYIEGAMLTKAGVATPQDIIPYRKPDPKPIPAGSTIYNVDLCDPIDHLWSKKTVAETVLDVFEDRYASGAANWNWEDHKVAASATTQFTTTGLSVTSAEMEWIALRIKSPGKGLYTVGLNHGVSGEGGTGAVYILPADTEDIDAAIDPSNRVGFVNFNNMTGIAAVDDGYQTLLNTWEFGDEEEYIVVFEAYKYGNYTDLKCYMYLSQLFMTPGNIMEETEEEKTISPIMVHPGPLKMLDACYYGTTAQVGGCNYLFMPIEGAKLMAIDLDNGVLVEEIKLPFNVTRGITTDENGIVWAVGDSHFMFRYDPVTRVGQTIKSFRPEAAGAQCAYYMDYGDGCLYFGTSPIGDVIKYEIATNTYTNLGGHEDCAYAAAVTYKDGYVYSGMNGDSNGDGQKTWVVAKIDVKTGEAVYTDVYDLLDPSRAIFYGAGFAGDLLLIGAEPIPGEENIIAIDSNTMEVVDLGVKGSISYGISEEKDGKVYFVLSGLGLYSIDVQTREVAPVPGMKDALIPIRCCFDSFVELSDPKYPGPSIVTYNGRGAARIYNLATGLIKSYNDILDDEYGNATAARPIFNGLPGSNELYIGGFNTDNCAIYNTETGELRHFLSASAQTDAMAWYDGVLYTGNYTAGCITRINLEDDTKNQVLLTLNDEIYDQARIHTLIAADDMLIAGSTPEKFQYGGCLAIVDLNTLERTIEHNIVQDQTVNCVVYHDGLVYGTTSTHGGSGTAKRDDLSAKLFIYDVQKKEKIAEFDLRNYLEGFTKNIGLIYGIAADPNVEENGKFWGLISETLFSFTFDKDTGKLSVKEELSFRKDNYPHGGGWSWFPVPFCFDGKGNLYLSFGSYGGLRRINMENPKDNELVMDYPALYYTLGEDGNLYYLRRTALWMQPLNVTDDDWAKADKVDQMILALDKEVTLKSEASIVAARTAYEALSLKHQALVQNLYVLEEAEADLLELQIDQLPETVTLEDKDLILGLQAKYDEMTTRNQRYVKNYPELAAAVSVLNVLIDKVAAAEVQAMIDTIKDLGEITLEHKDRIAEIRAAYNKLFSYQRQYVDATDLLEAEAVLAVLRSQEVERLKELIASIGEVTLEDEPTIVEADSIYSWLTMEERQQVDGATLSSAKIQLSKLQKAAAAEVDALIEKIGKVGIFSGTSISNARKAYDALTEGSKAYVTLLDTLTAAEKAFKPIVIALWCAGGVVVAGGGAATTVVLKKRKSKKVPEKTTESTQ